MDEKRRAPRVRANIIANFKLQTVRLAGGSRIKDISEVGLCLPSKHHFAVGSILEVEVRSEDIPEPIRATARVVRIGPITSTKYQFEVGLEFIDLPTDKRTLIQKFVQGVIARGESKDVAWMD